MLKRNILRIHTCIALLLLALISSPAFVSTIRPAETAPNLAQERVDKSAVAGAREAQLSATEVFERSNAAVARIDVGSEKGRFLGYGSGFIVRANGVILTSFHLIERAHSARVRLANGQIYDQVSIIAGEKRSDLAVLKINASNLPFLPLGNSDSVQVGEKIIAIGNPEGLENTISDGIVSGRRGASVLPSLELSEDLRLLQITAPISSGSSGGPLLDLQGNVIGVTFAFFKDGQNLSFAVPINYAQPLLDKEPAKTLARAAFRISDKPAPVFGIAPERSFLIYHRHGFGMVRDIFPGALTLSPTDVFFEEEKERHGFQLSPKNLRQLKWSSMQRYGGSSLYEATLHFDSDTPVGKKFSFAASPRTMDFLKLYLRAYAPECQIPEQ
jgi:trypsin-like peptidase